MSKRQTECLRCRELTEQEHIALRTLSMGEANEYQQKLALKVIVNVFSRTHDLLYVPDSFDQSALLNGRAFVGQKILKYLNLPVGKLQEDNNDVED